MNIFEKLHASFATFLGSTFSLNETQSSGLSFTINTQEGRDDFGDINSNAALVLAKILHKKPQEIAKQISQDFTHPHVSRIEIAGPGFINFFLTPEAYTQLATELYTEKKDFFVPQLAEKHTYSLEFVSANPTGPLHIGHGRGGIIGDVLGNILRFIGHKVTKEFYINDAGAQIEKLGRSFKIRCQQQLGHQIEIPEDGYQGEYLITLAQQCIAEYGPEVIDKDTTFFGNYAKEYLLKQIQKTLHDYGIQYDVWFSEKTLHESGAITAGLKELQSAGFLYEKDGALWFNSEKFGDDKDRVLRKASGELTYIAADVAYLLNKLHRKHDRLIMVLGQDHHSYVIRMKAILEALGHNPDHLDVILYQLVTLKETGVQLRLSKRAGRIVSLEDIIETVGKDVARFFYLNKKADAHLDFDLDLALKTTEENPVYYLQYAYVRCKSILEKSRAEPALQHITQKDAQNLGTEEQLILKKISFLKELLVSIGHNFQTHLLSYYVLELAQLFHKYYSKNRVLDAQTPEKSRARLLLVQILQNTFETTLTLLGINLPDKM